MVLAAELSYFFKLVNQCLLKLGSAEKWYDIVCKSKKLILEYDGSFWHGKSDEIKEKDKRETKLLQKEGWNVIRIREKPLLKITNSDLLFNKKLSEVEVCLHVIEHLMLVKILVSNSELKKAQQYLKLADFKIINQDVTLLSWQILMKQGKEPMKWFINLFIKVEKKLKKKLNT